MFELEELKGFDPELHAAIQGEISRQQHKIELIASEILNY